MWRWFLGTAAAVALAFCAQGAASAETFVLSTGGRVEGKLLNAKETPRERYVIQLAGGAKVAFHKHQVVRVVPDNAAESQYDQHLAKMPDTVDGHWKMAEWCLRNNLPAQREFHLQSILEQEPGHEKARLALGYTTIDGRWVKPDEYNRSLGYVKHQGAWRTPQDVAIATARQRQDDVQRKWRNDVKMWRSWLNRPSKQAEGLASLRAIRDLEAAPALVELLDDKEEPAQLKLQYVEILGQMAPQSPLARGALVNHALYNDAADVRDKCLEHLEKCDRAAVARMFVVALGDKNNKVVNRAAVGIARMNDPSAISSLIDALTTKHKFIVTTGGGGNLSTSFSPSGSGFSAGGGPKQIEQDLKNERVLEALIALSGGQNYQFDKDAWKRWYAESQTPAVVDLRRGR